MTHQRTGDACQETADEERQELVPEEVDTHHLRRQVVIPDRHESPPDSCSCQVLGKEHYPGSNHQYQVKLARLALELKRTEVLRAPCH